MRFFLPSRLLGEGVGQQDKKTAAGVEKKVAVKRNQYRGIYYAICYVSGGRCLKWPLGKNEDLGGKMKRGRN